MLFFVYSSNSTRLFIIIIVTMFHKLYVLFLKCGGCLFFLNVKHGGLFFCYRLPVGRRRVHCNMALYVRPIYIHLRLLPLPLPFLPAGIYTWK